jgi:hypothetical protein
MNFLQKINVFLNFVIFRLLLLKFEYHTIRSVISVHNYFKKNFVVI